MNLILFSMASTQIPISGLKAQVAVSDGSSNAPSISFSNDTNTGLYRAGADVLGVVTGGVERMRVDAAGNVGIGTTSPQAPLHVHGNIMQQNMSYIRSSFNFATTAYGTTYSTLDTNNLTGYITYTVDATNGDFFTVHKSGVYALTAGITVNTSSSGNVWAGFTKNTPVATVPYMSSGLIAGGQIGPFWHENYVMCTVPLQINDVVRVVVQTTTARTHGNYPANHKYHILLVYQF